MVRAGAPKRRYIKFEIKSVIEFSEEELKRRIYSEALKFFGEYLLSFVALKFMSYDKTKKTAIVRCNRDFYHETLGFLALVNSINGKKTRLIAKKASGTIKSLS